LDFTDRNLPLLAYGQGRSYGDCCLNDQGVVLGTRHLNKIIYFDKDRGVLKAEAGINFNDILSVIVPNGWFLPVTPGTQFVSLGGAIANDVHGKNHHSAGTFGCHVIDLELIKSDGTKFKCSKNENYELFCATIAGLGLTGFITNATIKLIPIKSSLINVGYNKFNSLNEFFEISSSLSNSAPYTVAWLDCVSTGKSFGRGIFMSGQHAEQGVLNVERKAWLNCPINLPSFTLNNFTVNIFNKLYFELNSRKTESFIQHYSKFFYPLDSVLNWNRIYGRKGFTQLQFVINSSDKLTIMEEILNIIVKSGIASFLAVLKEFGSVSSPGLLSFPRPGTTLCLDFPIKNDTENTINTILKIVQESSGAIYPAKDAFMSRDLFLSAYPNYEKYLKFKDPKFSSSFWRRLHL
jgi:FAD/FMN-containing dehydrogenase